MTGDASASAPTATTSPLATVAGPDGARRTGRTARWEAFVLAALVAMVVIPVVGAGIRMAVEGWYPTFDDAVIVQRGYDVFSAHSPIVGQFSLAGTDGGYTHSPGPMLFWYVAVPARVGPVWAVPVFTSLVNAACFAGVVLLARRRGGLGLAAVSAVGCLFLVRALGPATMAEVWNPWIGLVPLVLLVFLAWSIVDGDRRLLPVAVLVGSFTMQGHLSILFPSLALLAVAVIGGWGPVLLGRRRTGPALDRGAGSSRLWRPVGWAVLVGVACWTVPVYEQLTGDPGNLTLLARSSGEPGGRGGLLAVKATMWRSLGLPPLWTRGEQDPLRFATLSFSAVGWAQVLHVVAVLGLGAWLFAAAVRRADRLVASAVAVGGALVAGMVATAVSIPLDRGLVAGYTFRWFVIASLFVWLAIGLGVVRLWLVPAWRTRPRTGPDPAVSISRAARVPAPAAAGLAVLVGLGALALPWEDQFDFSYGPGERLAAEVVDATEPGGTYLVARSGLWDLGFTPVASLALRRHGRHPVVSGTRIEALGHQYAPEGRRCDGVIVLQAPDDAVDPTITPLADIAVPDSGYLPDRMLVGIAPDTSPDGLC